MRRWTQKIVIARPKQKQGKENNKGKQSKKELFLASILYLRAVKFDLLIIISMWLVKKTVFKQTPASRSSEESQWTVLKSDWPETAFSSSTNPGETSYHISREVFKVYEREDRNWWNLIPKQLVFFFLPLWKVACICQQYDNKCQ